MFFKTTILSALLATAFAAPSSELEVRQSGKAVDYTQNYVASGASVSFTPNQSKGQFSINFNTKADFVCGLGWKTGDSNPITYSGSFSGSGVALLSIYGWTTNPLVEYYVIENPIGYPKQGTKQGTFTSDGSTYDVYLHQQVNQPSISGTTTFNQYISIRNSPRSSGTVTIANHFNQWASYGLKLGTQNYQTLSVESWSGSGTGSLTVAKGTSSGGGGSTGGGGSSPVSSAPSSGPTSSPPSSGNCAAKYGQCGGQGWQGATCCASGSTCKASNSYYSQCL